MIPRIIHYCWLSGEPFPDKVKECIDSWQKLLSEWEFRLWDMNAVSQIDNVWLQECIQARQWAFASDYIRLYAVHRYGGVYLDTDCMLYRSLDSLLDCSAFIGQEWYVHIDCFTTQRYLTSHCFGAVSGHPFISRCLHYYDDRHFVRSSDSTLPAHLRFDQTLLPKIQSDIAQLTLGYNPSPLIHDVQRLTYSDIECLDCGVFVYPNSYFDCYDQRRHTFVRHLAMGGWSEARKRSDQIQSSVRTSWIRSYLDYLLGRIMWRFGYILTKKQ